MVLENLGFSFGLNRIYGAMTSRHHDPNVGAGVMTERRSSRKGKQRKAASGDDGAEDAAAESSLMHYPGLVNMSGTYCFMNSVLQALASQNYLLPYMEVVCAKAEYWDVPTPVIDCLRQTLSFINTPTSHRTSLRPVAMIDVLSAPVPHPSTTSSPSSSTASFKTPLFSSREHQDAQELFQLISSLMKDEAVRVDREPSNRELARGLSGALAPPENLSSLRRLSGVEVSRSVFDGLTANRRSCAVCGYTEAVMHFGFDNLQLSLPQKATITLEECLADLTRIEILTDCVCRKCSLLATYKRLQAEVERLAAADGPPSQSRQNGSHPAPQEHNEVGGLSESVSASKKKRIREMKKYEAKVGAALAEGRIEDDLGKTLESWVEKVVSRASTKQVMIARTPPVLVLHLNRSSFLDHAAQKNSCGVVYPELLDLSPFMTSGQLSTVPSLPMSSPHISSSISAKSSRFHSVIPSPSPSPSSAATDIPTPQTSTHSPTSMPPSSKPARILYLLSAIVCHYGTHGFGHYVAYRRKPRAPIPATSSSRPVYQKRFPPPTITDLSVPFSGRGWLRISDEAVDEVGIEAVLNENSAVFMAFYERIVLEQHTSSINPAITPSSSASVSDKPVPNGVHRLGSGHTQLNGPARIGTSTENSFPLAQASAPRIVRSLSTRVVPHSEREMVVPSRTRTLPPSSASSEYVESATSTATIPAAVTNFAISSNPTPVPSSTSAHNLARSASVATLSTGRGRHRKLSTMSKSDLHRQP